MKKAIFALLTLIVSNAHADSMYGGYGLGMFNSAKSTASETKVGQVGYLADIWSGTYWQFKVGYWGDGSGDKSRRNSAYASTGPGLLIDLRPIEIRSGWGLAFVSTPDSMLGGSFPQFNGDLYIGLRDKRGNGIGIQLEHISSAGLVKPNTGRDFLTLQISQSW
jgi:hypothetical protein